MEILLIFWLLFAAACSFIASEKGHNAGAWFVIGMVGGIFALVAIIAVPKKEISRNDG